ncbi:MAG: YbhB/YbcL family Raf kinase inhibitor-like protein [Methylosarcina sp.]
MRTIKINQSLRLIGLIFCFYSADLFALKKAPLPPLTLKSFAFEHQNAIPKQFTCDDANFSPQLSWANVPSNAKSLVLIMDDPDAPAPVLPFMRWVHWLLYNIPPTTSGLPQNVSSRDLPKGTLEGKNDWKETGFKGPCPPIGRHRYFFKLYALDTVLPDLHLPDSAVLEKAMDGHILDRAELIGVYQRKLIP